MTSERYGHIVRTWIIAICAPLAVLGCQANGSPDRQTLGTVLGAAAGGLLGSQVGDGAGRIVAIAIGAGAGAWLGNRLGAYLDEQEQAAVSRQSAEALNETADGQSVTWRNPDSGTTAVITPKDTREQERQVPIVREKAVAAPPSLALIGKAMEAKSNSNVRAGPGTDTAIIATLRAGERIHAVGRVSDQDWIMVARDNRSIGYVYAPLLREAPDVQMAETELTTPSPGPPTGSATASAESRQELRPAVDLDALKEQNKSEGVDLDAQGLVAENVTVKTECRQLSVQVAKQDGAKGQDDFRACRGADGAWEII